MTPEQAAELIDIGHKLAIGVDHVASHLFLLYVFIAIFCAIWVWPSK